MAVLQQNAEQVAPQVCRIFTACLACGFIPEACRQVKVTFMPKHRKSDYTAAKAYRPISLSFLLKTMEILVDTYITIYYVDSHFLDLGTSWR
jgi:hypothetical protein